jgi:hypothetical protein
MRLKDLMQRTVVSVSPDLTLRELTEVLTEQEVSGAPVVTGGVVVGVISMTDIFQFREDAPDVTLRPGGVLDDSEGAPRRRAGSPSEYFADSAEPAEIDALLWMKTTHERDWDLLDEYTVADVMTRDVMSRASDSSVLGRGSGEVHARERDPSCSGHRRRRTERHSDDYRHSPRRSGRHAQRLATDSVPPAAQPEG